jgi:hypothetical protein
MFSWLFSLLPRRSRGGTIPRLFVSISMRSDLVDRIDRVARHLEVPGDLLVGHVLEQWLEQHEDTLLELDRSDPEVFSHLPWRPPCPR